jgi:hypothetical protein
MAQMHRDHARTGAATLARWKSPAPWSYPAAMLRKYLVALSIGLAIAGAALAEPRSGIDISAIDPAVPPQQDFW